MSVELLTRQAALEMGLFIAGYDDYRLRHGVMMNLPRPFKHRLNGSRSRTVDVYKIRRPSGEPVQILIGQFGYGHALWIRDPTSGNCQQY